MSQQKSSGGMCLGGCCMGALVVLVVCVVGGFFGFRFLKGKAEEFTESFAATEPVVIEAPQSSPEEIERSLQKFEIIRAATSSSPSSSAPAQALPSRIVLTSDDLNNLLHHHPDLGELQGKASMKIENGLIHSQLSIDLEEFGELPTSQLPKWLLPETEGRYFNGQATISLAMAAGRPVAHLEDVKVGEIGLPAFFLSEIKKENLLKNYDSNPRMKAYFDKIQDIRVEGDRLIIVPK